MSYLFLGRILAGIFALAPLLAQAAPQDVNGDGIVGPQEALDLAESWKGRALPAGGVQPWQIDGATIFYNTGRVGIGSATPHHQLRVSGGPIWTANGWTGSLELDNAAAIGWRANAGGQRFGIGQTGGGLYFFRTASDPGTVTSEAQYGMIINDADIVNIPGSLGIGGDIASQGARFQVNDGRIRIRETATVERWDLFYDPPSQKFYLQENAAYNHLVFTKGPNHRVGIGADDPAAKLEVRATDAAAAVRAVGSGGAGTALEIVSGAIRVPGAGANTPTPVFIHVANTENSRSCDNTGCFCYSTLIDHPMTNNDPNAILFVLPNGVAGSGRPFVDRIGYDPLENKWVITLKFGEHFCTGQKFNVLVFKS